MSSTEFEGHPCPVCQVSQAFIKHSLSYITDTLWKLVGRAPVPNLNAALFCLFWQNGELHPFRFCFVLFLNFLEVTYKLLRDWENATKNKILTGHRAWYLQLHCGCIQVFELGFGLEKPFQRLVMEPDLRIEFLQIQNPQYFLFHSPPLVGSGRHRESPFRKLMTQK